MSELKVVGPSERAQSLVQVFQGFSTWEERYQEIIRMGKALPELPEVDRLEKYLVKGCQSQVWLLARKEGDLVYFNADSDALIVRGLVAVALHIYSGATPKQILNTSVEFVSLMGFQQNLSMNRANGFRALLKQIYQIAHVYSL